MLQAKDLVTALVLGLQRTTSRSKSSGGPHSTITVNGLAAYMQRPVSSVHKSLQQGTKARLISHKVAAHNGSELVSYAVRREAIREFVLHGVRYAYPVRLGARERGMATAWAAPPLSVEMKIASQQMVVWADADGEERGEAMEPLHECVLVIAKKEPVLYQALSLIDAIRVGQARERRLASELFSTLLDENMQ
jgi:hypothetical protein